MVEGTATSFRDYTRYQWTILIVFAFVNWVSAITYSIQAPFYPREAERKNATATEAGWVFGSYELTACVLSSILGSYMHIIGPRTGFSIGVFVAGTSMILFGFLDRINDRVYFIVFSVLLRVFQGCGTSCLFVSIYSFVTLEFPNSVAATFGIMETAFGFGLCTGPPLGEFLYQAGGFTLPFAIPGGILVLSPIASYFLLLKPNELTNLERDYVNNNASSHGGILNLIRIPAIAINIFGTFIGGYTIGFITASLEPHIRQFDLSPTSIGLMFLSYASVYAIFGPIIGSICDRISEPEYITLTGSTLIFVAFLAIGPAPFIPIEPNLWLTLGGLIIFGLGLGAIYVSTFFLTLKEARNHDYPDTVATYGVVSGLWMSGLSLGSFSGPVAAGLLKDYFGFRNATLSIFVLTFVFTLLSVVSIIKRKSWLERNSEINSYSDGRSLLNSPGFIWNDVNVGETIQ